MRINKSSTAKGFTLIELLIVIAIIGILAVIVLAILNPQLQRDRARDGMIRSTMTKMNQAVQAFYAVHLRVPNATAEFPNEVENFTLVVTENHGVGFRIEGVDTDLNNGMFVYSHHNNPPQREGCIRTILFEKDEDASGNEINIWIFINRNGVFTTSNSSGYDQCAAL